MDCRKPSSSACSYCPCVLIGPQLVINSYWRVGLKITGGKSSRADIYGVDAYIYVIEGNCLIVSEPLDCQSSGR